jgi:hypothetical protein
MSMRPPLPSEGDFHAAAIRQYAEAKRLGYSDERYAQMLNERGAMQTAYDLVAEPRLHPMFTRLAGDRAFELTVEWLILRTEFQPLFEPTLIARARERLTQVGWTA